MKKQNTVWEMILANQKGGKGLYPEYMKNFQNLIRRKQTIQFFKGAKHLNRYITKEETLMVNEHMKRYSTYLTLGRWKLKPQ